MTTALHTFLFGEFRLDTARRELWRGDALQALTPKVFDCIAYLIEHRARAVGRDELIASVWGRAGVTDNLLDQVMLRVRRLLEDTDSERRMIRTVPRFGYIWVAPTQIIEQAARIDEGSAEHADRVADPKLPQNIAEDIGVPPLGQRWRRAGWHRVAWVLLAALTAGLVAWSGKLLLVSDNDLKGSLPVANLALLLPVVVDADSGFAWARLGAMDLIADRLRIAGQPMLASDNVVALSRNLRAAVPDADELQTIVDTSAASLVLQARATHSVGYWRVTVSSLQGRDPPLLVEGEAKDLLDAAQAAADRTARALGLMPIVETDVLSVSDRALSGLLQQVEAAMLADQPDTARALLDSLASEQRAKPEVRYRRAMIEFLSGNLDVARPQFQALLDAAATTEDPLFHARVLSGLGNIALRRDDYAPAERYADAIVALLEKRAPTPELGRALSGRAIARSAQSRFDLAVADFAKARVVLESVGDRLSLARVDANLGILEARRERYAEALPLLDSAAGRFAIFHDLTSELFVRVAAAYARLAMLDPAAALEGDHRLKELAEREPSAQERRYATLARAEVLEANGRLGEARRLLSGVLADATEVGDVALLASASALGARQALADGKPRTARELAGKAAESLSRAELPRERPQARLTVLRAQIALGVIDKVAFEPKHHAFQDDSAASRIDVALATAIHAAAISRPTEADAAFEIALAAAEMGRVPQDLLAVCDAYASYLISVGELERAGTVAGRVAIWADRSYEAALLQTRLYHALNQIQPWQSALARAGNLAGERTIPADLVVLGLPSR